MYKCECGREFEKSQSFNGHKSNCTIHLVAVGKIKNEQEWLLMKQQQNKLSAEKRSNNVKLVTVEKLQQWISEQHKCERCGKIMTEKFGSGRFCSRSCANGHVQSEETKEKIGKSILKNINIINSYKSRTDIAYNNYLLNPKLCKCCGKPISYELRRRKCCSDSCSNILKLQAAIKGTKLAQQLETKRSKNEIYFYELCEKYFKNVRHNEPIFNGWDADIIIEDIKYAVLWNGPWHYRQIKKDHSVKQVQNRDKIKIEEIKKAGYMSYIIKDDKGFNSKFVEDQFKIFIESLK